jgi:hypothetical protein
MIPGPQQPFIAAASALTALVGSILGTGPTQRNNKINEVLAQSQYLAPTALNVMQGQNGTYEDFDARGNLRTSTMSAIPTVLEPYITSRVINGQRVFQDAPGSVSAPYSGSAPGSGQAPVAGGQTIVIQAMDSESFGDFLRKPGNSSHVGEALADHLQRNDGRASAAIRHITGTE